MATIRVPVYDKPYDVTTYQKSKTVWVATGQYLGETISVESRSAKSAAGLWRDAAKYRGNG